MEIVDSTYRLCRETNNDISLDHAGGCRRALRHHGRCHDACRIGQLVLIGEATGYWYVLRGNTDGTAAYPAMLQDLRHDVLCGIDSYRERQALSAKNGGGVHADDRSE